MENLSAFAIPRKCDVPDRAYGVWQIPDLNIMIPVYEGNNQNHQEIIDKDNSACIEKYGAGRMINDHAGSLSINGKGKWRIGDVKPDMVGFLVRPGRTDQYVCTMVCRAERHTHAYVLNGQTLWPRSSTDIACIGCATRDAEEVYIAMFRYKGKIP